MRKKNGFSLVEVIVVITVLAIVLAIAIGMVQNNVDKANEKVEVIISQNVIEALNLYSKEFNKEINWAVNGASVKSACVPFSKLVDKGYLKENEMLDGYKGNNIRIVQNNGINHYNVFKGSYEECQSEYKSIHLLTINTINDGNRKYLDEIMIDLVFDDKVLSSNLGVINSSNAPKISYRFGNGALKNASFVSADDETLSYKVTVDLVDNGEFKLEEIKGVISNLYNTLNLSEEEYNFAGNIKAKTVAQIGSNYYYSLNDAFNNNLLESDVVLVNNISDCSAIIPSGKTINLDLKGKTLTCDNGPYVIENNGTLNISDSVSWGSLKANSGNVINNKASLTLNSGVINSINNYGIQNYNSALVYINAGEVQGKYAIYNDGAGSITVNNGVINGSDTGIYNNSLGTVTVNNGSIKGYTAVFNNTGTVAINNGIVEASYIGVLNKTGSFSIKTGSITGKTYGVYGEATNTITIGNSSDTLSTTLPKVSGGTHGVYMSSSSFGFYFYNGLIAGTSATPYQGAPSVRSNYKVSTTGSGAKYNTTLVRVSSGSSSSGGSSSGSSLCSGDGWSHCHCSCSFDDCDCTYS